MRNLQLHDHSDKAELYSKIFILNPQYICQNGTEKPLQYYFALGALVIQEVHSILIEENHFKLPVYFMFNSRSVLLGRFSQTYYPKDDCSV